MLIFTEEDKTSIDSYVDDGSGKLHDKYKPELLRANLIEYVKATRKDRKVSMREIKENTGLSIAFISDMENLKKDVGLERFLKYLDAFGLTVIIAPKKSKVAEIQEACKTLISLLKY